MDLNKILKLRVKKNDSPIKDVLSNYVKQEKIGPGYYNSKIQQIWTNKMGTSINKHTLKLRFTNNELFVTMDSAALKHELSLGKAKLIKLLNQELGGEIISNIYFW